MSFKRLDPEDISISAESVVAPAWSGQLSTLTTFFTGSQAALSSGDYYYNIYQTSSTATGAEIQFAVAYGNRRGSGSIPLTSGIVEKTPSSIIYGQYRTLVNGDEDTDFTFGTRVPNSVYVISVNRSRYKEKLLPGSFNLTLTSGSKTIKLTDDSNDATTTSYVDAGRVFNIVSGSDGTESTASNAAFKLASGSYGKFLPDIGTIILNGDALKDANFGIQLKVSESFNTDGDNITAMHNAIKVGASFTLRSEETITSDYVFVRVRNSEFNYSTNPSNITGSGDLRWNIMINSPQSYMTTVGLYNDNNDLLAVAKLSKPLLKDFTKESLVRIKLDY